MCLVVPLHKASNKASLRRSTRARRCFQDDDEHVIAILWALTFGGKTGTTLPVNFETDNKGKIEIHLQTPY